MAQELHFIEAASGDWFYIIERPNAPKDQWDWMDDADAFGPFPSYEAACDHEYASPSDTSGAEIFSFNDTAHKPSETAWRMIDALLARAA